ncbi:hypothetical protein LCM27_01865 [Ruegeria marisrubri]|uniref:hypothetical protein n=1 Tax=Ruegeria marisrubri TaxID=1685379 RepID=UPI001CD702DF|nr:hypothetical protein [Ruegeria marisrubri]MCA0905139.1 hypothetical protein [Ruegeria marisrubri]
MLPLDFESRELEKVADAYEATPKQVKLSGIRAAKRTAGTIRRISSKGLQTELGLRNARALRRRIKEYRVDGRWTGYKVWIGTNDLPLSAFKGRPKKVAGGIKFGETMIHGAFLAKVGGKRGVYKRTGDGSYPIIEPSLPVADRMVIYLEDEVFVDVDNIFFKHFTSEIRARTQLGVG